MTKSSKFASEYRSDLRKKNRESQMREAKSFIDELFSVDQLHEAWQNKSYDELQRDIENAIEKRGAAPSFKKMLYHCWRKRINLFNSQFNADLALPARHFLTLDREPMRFDREWLQRSKHASMIHNRLWRYWNTSSKFSDDEVIGNVLISSIVFGGISAELTLQALLQKMKDGPHFYFIRGLDLNVLLLEPFSPGYGDLYDHAGPLRKSRTFVLDKITQLWMIRFLNSKPLIKKDTDEYLSLVLRKCGGEGKKAEISRLLRCASALWAQP